MDDEFFEAAWTTADVGRIYLIDQISVVVVDAHWNLVDFLKVTVFLDVVVD